MRKIKFLLLTAVALVLTACRTRPAAYLANQPLGPQINYTITGIDAGAG